MATKVGQKGGVGDVVNSKIAAIHKLFKEDSFTDAVTELRDLSKLMAKTKESGTKDANVYAKLVAGDSILREVEQMGNEMFDLVASVAPNTLDGGGWKPLVEASHGDMTYYREEGEGKQSFRIQGFVNAPLLRLASLIYELDLWPNWFPGIVNASRYAQLSKFRIVPLLESWLPWPMANRSLKLKAYGDVFNGDSVAIFARDLEPCDLASSKLKMPSSPTGCVDIRLYFAGFHLVPLSKDVTYLKAIFCLNPQLVIPDKVFNYICSKTCGVLLSVIRSSVTAEKFKGSEYEKRMKTVPAYDEMRKRLASMKFEQNATKYLGKVHQEAFKVMGSTAAPLKPSRS